MRTVKATIRLLVFLVLLCVPLSLYAQQIPKLSAPPLGERWFSISLSGERVGYAHLSISQASDGYRIDSDGSVKMRVMGFSREATSKETYLVDRDLAVRSFAAEGRIDGSPMSVKGEVTPSGIHVAVQSGSGRKERTLKVRGAVYPSQALNLYPFLKGTPVGKTAKVPMLDVESVKVKEIKVEVVGPETLPPGTPVIHLQNNLYPMVGNDIWVDLNGNTIRESVRDDLVVTQAESAESAKAYLADTALSKSDLALDFSLIKVTPPLERPAQLRKLVIDFTGIPKDFPLLQGIRQQATRLSDGAVRFTMPNPVPEPPGTVQSTASDLESTSRIPSDHPAIVAKKDEILAGEKDPCRAAQLLMGWVAKEVKAAVTDNQSPVETLKTKKGNCQTHARLYAALARSAGIPTRFVSGLVYLEGTGFLYHSWDESYLNGAWLPLDPTFGEFPANFTHIKLVVGDSPDDLALLAGVIGKVHAQVVEKGY